MKRTFLAVGLMVLALSLVACSGDATTDAGIVYDGEDTEAPPSAGMCAPDMPDCVDVVVDDPAGDVFDSEAAIAEAQALLGVTAAELGPDVRVARQGEEWMMLTEDYRIGRLTVELDINDMDEWIVTAVTVELPDAPQTFTRHLR